METFASKQRKYTWKHKAEYKMQRADCGVHVQVSQWTPNRRTIQSLYSPSTSNPSHLFANALHTLPLLLVPNCLHTRHTITHLSTRVVGQCQSVFTLFSVARQAQLTFPPLPLSLAMDRRPESVREMGTVLYSSVTSEMDGAVLLVSCRN